MWFRVAAVRPAIRPRQGALAATTANATTPRDASSCALVPVVPRSCSLLPPEDALQLSCERFSTRCCPPAGNRATGPLRRDRLLSARVGERPTGMIVRFSQRPEFEPLGSGHMVGELAQPRLQSTKGTNAGGDLRRRCRSGKHFQCIPELLRSDSHPVDLAIVAEAVVEVVQKPPDKPSRPPAGVRVDRLGQRRRLDGHEQRGGLLLPTTALHAGDLVLESASRLRPFLRQHLRKPLPGHSSGGGLPGRCRRPATAGENIEITGFSGRTANPAE